MTSQERQRRFKVGIDVGGTFTDFFVREAGREPVIHKVLSTPNDPSVGVLAGMHELAGALEQPLQLAAFLGAVEVIVHGTTVTTNDVSHTCYPHARASAAIRLSRHQTAPHQPNLLASVRHLYPWLRHVFADAAYAGDKLAGELARLGKWTLEIVRRLEAIDGFQLLKRHWVVERTLAWLNRNRRLAKDFEASVK